MKQFLHAFAICLTPKTGAVLAMLMTALLYASSSFSQSQTFNNSGTFTVPVDVTDITVECWGAGGAGGNRTANGVTAGGGGGAYSRKIINSVTPGSMYTVTVGPAPGGDSWFESSTTVMAKGGNSVPTNGNIGATGGDAALGFGDVKYSGGKGANGGGYGGGGGGSSAGTDMDGANGSGNSGGLAPAGGGDGGNGKSSSTGTGPGAAGSLPGGGGGGSYRNFGSPPSGGVGAKGRVVVSWPCPAGPATIDYPGGPFQTDAAPQAVNQTGSGGGTYAADPAGLSVNAGSGLITPGTSTPGTYTVTYNYSGGCTTTTTVTIIPPPPPPDISLKGNGNAITNRALTVSASDDTDFGTAAVAGGMVTRTFTIENAAGSLDLKLDGLPLVEVADRDQSDFSVTQPVVSVLSGGSSTTFDVKFDPSATGLRSAIIVITHNDLPENPFVFTVQGMGN